MRTQNAMPRKRPVRLRDVLDVGVAQILLVRSWWLVRTRATGNVITPGTRTRVATGWDPEVVARCDRAVDRAARHGFLRPTCLVRAMALRQMLEMRGVRGTGVRVGVRWVEGRFAAHAWVEVSGQPLGMDGSQATHFDVVDDMEVVRG